MANFTNIETDIKKIKTDPFFSEALPEYNTDEEEDQLAKNILNDMEVRDPFIVWLDPDTNEYVLIDGHHRLKVLLDNPDLTIQYTVKESDFPDKWSAKIWQFENALGRRNLTERQEELVIGEYYDALKMAHGASDGFRGNQHTESGNVVSGKDCHLPKSREQTAEKFGVSERTVENDAALLHGVQAAEQVAPGFTKDVESGKITAPKQMIADLTKVPEEFLEDAVDAVSSINSDNTAEENKENRAWAKQVMSQYIGEDNDEFVPEPQRMETDGETLKRMLKNEVEMLKIRLSNLLDIPPDDEDRGEFLRSAEAIQISKEGLAELQKVVDEYEKLISGRE